MCIRDRHIVSHGAPGCLVLGNSTLSLSTIPQYASALSHWLPHHLDSSLTLYGCNVAAGDAGAEFIQKLHTFTGANIAASVHKVGHPELGGCWDLNDGVGAIKSRNIFSQTLQQTYLGTFPTPVSNITTLLVPATPSDPIISAALPQATTVSNFFPDGTYTTRFGQGSDRVLNGFSLGGQNYSQFSGATTNLVIRRNNNALFSGIVHAPFFSSVLNRTALQNSINAGSNVIDVETTDVYKRQAGHRPPKGYADDGCPRS